jgi:hypothetical protein
MNEQLLLEIDKKKDKLIALYRKYSIITIRPDSTAADWMKADQIGNDITKLESELASLKSQLSEQIEDHPVYDENYLKECMDKSRLNKPGITDDDK